MSKSLRTSIEWAHYTLNFWWGCAKVSPACLHCYAETLARVFSKGQATWGVYGARWLRFDSAAAKLKKIVRAAQRGGFRPRVFVNSMSDTFEENEVLDVTRCMMLVLMADTPEVDFLLLTKRPENVEQMVPMSWLSGEWPRNIWLGTTVENQEMADARLPVLVGLAAPVKFVSCEPLLGPLDISIYFCSGFMEPPQPDVIDWVICGGESGPGARPTHPTWARQLRDHCQLYGVPFFFKQWGGWAPGGGCDDACGKCIHALPDGSFSGTDWEAGPHLRGSDEMHPLGKKSAGRKLDGREWDELPEVAS